MTGWTPGAVGHHRCGTGAVGPEWIHRCFPRVVTGAGSEESTRSRVTTHPGSHTSSSSGQGKIWSGNAPTRSGALSDSGRPACTYLPRIGTGGC